MKLHVNCGCSIYFDLNFAYLICPSTYIAKYFRESVGLRDNNSRQNLNVSSALIRQMSILHCNVFVPYKGVFGFMRIVRIQITLQKHAYSNILRSIPPKKWKFSVKRFWNFSYFCWKTKIVFQIRIIMFTPANPSFTSIYKWGLRGSTLYMHVSVMLANLPCKQMYSKVLIDYVNGHRRLHPRYPDIQYYCKSNTDCSFTVAISKLGGPRKWRKQIYRKILGRVLILS